jgi:hypothetical protein
MDTLIVFAGPALVITTSVVIALVVRGLAGDGSGSSLHDLMSPLVAGMLQDPSSRPIVREPELEPWKFDGLALGSSAI